MDGLGSGHRAAAGDRRVGFVSRQITPANQYYYGGAWASGTERVDSVGRTRSESSVVTQWDVKDPERRRRKRLAKYKVYTVEGRVKASLRNGYRWIKTKCSQIVLGY